MQCLAMTGSHAIIIVAGILLLLIATTPSSAQYGSVATVKFLLMVSGANISLSRVVSAVDQTLEEINYDYLFLSNHRLEYILSENQVSIASRMPLILMLTEIQCSGADVLDTFFAHAKATDVVAVITDCSSNIEEVTKLGHYFNISVVSIN